jgi:hypothetical protein
VAGEIDTPLVECHSEFTYAERPTALYWQGERLEIEAIEAQWRIPGGRRFRVRTAGPRLFELFYGELYDEWRIHPID